MGRAGVGRVAAPSPEAGEGLPQNRYDREMEVAIGRMLQVGVSLAALVVLVGGGMSLWGVESPVPAYGHFTEPAYRSLLGGLRASGRADAVVYAGILLLVATPVVRVGFCTAGFARQRDWLYVGVSACVLAILMYSLVAGGR